MQSIQSRFFNFMLRNRHILSGKFRKEVFDENTSIQAFRDRCEQGAARFARMPEGLEVKPFLIGDMKAEWLIPAGAAPEKAILYVHGGGYVSGSCNDHRGIVSKFSARAGFRTLIYEYRLAPEYPFPAALDDSVAAVKWMYANGFKPENIVIAGESAGGGLCLALLPEMKDRNLPMPAAAVAISPWTDLTCSGDSYRTRNRYSLAPMNSWKVFSGHYCGKHDPSLPGISPLFGDLSGLPPLFINAGEDDELYDDGKSFYLKAEQAGVEVIFHSGKRQVHCYPLLAPMFREASEAMKEIVDFVKFHLRSGATSA
jgi:acetyl esterase/lipase